MNYELTKNSTSKPISHPVHHTIPKKKTTEKDRNPYDGLRPWSAITHGFGALLAVIGVIFLLSRSISLGASATHVVTFFIYGLTMIVMYTASTLYHSLNTSVKGRIALKKFDHCCIYFLIAGSYTPICMVALSNDSSLGLILCSIIWGLTAAGMVLTLVWISAPRWLTAGTYIFMGWISVLALGPLSQALPTIGMVYLLGGGVLYTVGGILYAVKWPGRNRPYFGCHEIFHVFILLGSMAHFFMMYHVILFLP